MYILINSGMFLLEILKYIIVTFVLVALVFFGCFVQNKEKKTMQSHESYMIHDPVTEIKVGGSAVIIMIWKYGVNN